MVTENDIATLPELRLQVSILQRDFYKHADEVNKSLQRIFDFISGEAGARREREQGMAMIARNADLTWTKVMAVAAVLGAFQVAPTILHILFK